jgi:DNA gyrase inhibitor GyrI
VHNATLLHHDRSTELSAPRPQDWTAVRARPLLVLSLRNPGAPETWLDTWRSLTALVFESGLATRQTQAIEVHYDAPEDGTPLRRFDACLSMPSPDVAAGVTTEDLCQVPGVRLETIMGHGPFLHRRAAPCEFGNGPLEPASPPPPGGPRSASHIPAWPCYHVYGCTPALAAGVPAVTDVYVTLKPAASGQPRTPRQ